MKMLCFILMICISWVDESCFAANPPFFISLGRDCQVANAIKNHHLREAALPFDWLVSHNFQGIILAIEDNFENFLDPYHLEYQTNSIYNHYYNFHFNHFFPLINVPITEIIEIAGTIVPNYLDHLPAVAATQSRRIKRFETLLNSNEFLIFVRTHIQPYEAQNLISILETKYPDLEFLLVVAHERLDLAYDWNIDKVLNFYARDRSGNADWWKNSEWTAILHKALQEVERIRNLP